MDWFESIGAMGHEQVLLCHEPSAGLRAIIAIHDTTLGPALGGCRVRPYRSTAEAMTDVLRLSRAMSFKAALAGLDIGGGKAVVIADPADRSEAMFRALGRHIESLGGRYVTAEDMNTSQREMAWIRKETRHVTGLDPADGGVGDPGEVTALGTFHGVRASLRRVFGSPDPAGRRVAIQGVGSVGLALAGFLAEAGARLSFTDVDAQRARAAADRFGGTTFSPDAFLDQDVDVLSPNAVGGVIGAAEVGRIRAPIVCGAANNVLVDERAQGEALRRAGVLFAPDYVVNSGGILNVFGELAGYDRAEALRRVGRVEETTTAVFARADSDGVAPIVAAERLAMERIEAVRALRRL